MNRRLPPGVDVQTLAAKRTRKAESASSASPAPVSTLAPPRAPATRKLTQEELRQRVHASLNVDNPPDNSASLVDTESQMTLPVMEIEPYDRNPRHTRNALFESMKESIRATGGLRTPLTVTRRPGAKRYMIESGGNTRLLCLQTLFQETGERRFESIVVTYRPWVSESHVLTSHFIENEVRGDMTFWDKAVGLLVLKSMLEQENKGAALSARDFEAKLKERGLQVSRTVIGSYVFATGQLGALGEATTALSRKNVRDLHPVFTALERLLKHANKGEDWPALRDRTLRSAEQSWKMKQVAQSEAAGDEDASEKAGVAEFDTARLIEQLDQSVATHLGEAPEFVRGCRELAQQQAASDDIAPCVMQMRIAQQPRSAPPRATPSSTGILASSVQAGSGDKRPAPTPSSAQRDPHAGDRHSTASTGPAGEAECLARVQALADSFAQATGVLDCLFVQDDWPTGFWIEIPSDPIDLDPSPANHGRYAGWWMLAMLSGQIGGAWSAAMPADSMWRQAQRQENGHDEVSLMGLIETVLANPIGLMELSDRLVGEPDAPEIDDYLRLVQALRALRREAPHRFAMEP